MNTHLLQFFIPAYREKLKVFLESVSYGIEVYHVATNGESHFLVGDRREPLTSNLIDPIRMREVFRESEIDQSDYVVISSEEEIERYTSLKAPFILRCGEATRFIQYGADTMLQYYKLMNVANQTSMVLEYGVQGRGIWAIGFVLDGAFQLHTIVHLEWLDGTYRFPMALNVPVNMDASEKKVLSSFSDAVVKVLALQDGPIRIEYSYDEVDGLYRVCEVDIGWFSTALPVDILALNGSGSYWHNQIRMLQGEDILPPVSASCGVSVQWMYSRSGIVEEVIGVEEVLEMAGVEEVGLRLEVSTELGHVLDVESRDCIGYVAASGATLDEAQETAGNARNRIHIRRKTVL